MADNKKNGVQKRPPSRSKAAAAARAQEIKKEKRAADANRIVSVIIFALSLLFFFIAVIEGAGAWNVLHNVYLGLFGFLAAIIFPMLAVTVTIIHSVKTPNYSKMIAKGIESIIMVLLVGSLIHIFQNDTGDEFLAAIKTGYSDAPTTFNGGFFGAVIGWAFLTFGKAPAIIVDLVLIFVDFMLLSGITIIQFFKGATKPAKTAYEKTAPMFEEHFEKRRMSKENIDIPLDEDSVVEKKPKKAGKKAKDTEEEESVPRDIIDEINAATAKNRKQRLEKNNDTEKEKSIDEIVENASTSKTNDAEKEKKPQEAFVVSKEQMSASVTDYTLPPIGILKPMKSKSVKDVSGELKENAERLIETLHSFNVDATITDISRGPTVTRYELKPASGIRISKITNLADDIALNLAATHVRIEAPIPGKAAVGIEVPNTVKNGVSMHELVAGHEFHQQRSLLTAGLGRDISGSTVYCDIAKMPHLLIAGTTGSGKSVCMNSIIVSVLYRAKPDEVKLLLIDPKKVEFSKYSGIPHLLVPVVTDPRKAAGALGWAVSEMLQRYQKFSDTGVRDIEGYNKYVKKHEDMEPLPKIMICIDELSDLMMAAPKEIEDSICRLAQMARAAGMHLVIATQRPSVDVITGLIKANISSRIALTVSSQIDSRTILDSGGAEKLLGRGDMLYAPIGSSKPIRVQGCFISDDEVEELCDFVKNQGESQYSEEIQKEIEEKAVQDKKSSRFMGGEKEEQLDALFEKAVDVVLENGTASTSFLQRKLSVGYARGAKIIDQLQDKGIIGPQDGSKARKILIDRQQWMEMQAYSSNEEFTEDNTEQITFNIEEKEIDRNDFDRDDF